MILIASRPCFQILGPWAASYSQYESLSAPSLSFPFPSELALEHAGVPFPSSGTRHLASTFGWPKDFASIDYFLKAFHYYLAGTRSLFSKSQSFPSLTCGVRQAASPEVVSQTAYAMSFLWKQLREIGHHLITFGLCTSIVDSVLFELAIQKW